MNKEYYQIETRTSYRHFPDQDCWDEDFCTKDFDQAMIYCLEKEARGEFVRIRKISKSLIYITEE